LGGRADAQPRSQVAAFEDHFVLIDQQTVPAPRQAPAPRPRPSAHPRDGRGLRAHGIRLHGPGRPYQAGVCHRIVVEDYAMPGDIIVLTDSHTPTAGVLNAFAFGVGSHRDGLRAAHRPDPGHRAQGGAGAGLKATPRGLLSPKDLILHLIGDPYFRDEQWRTSPTDTCVIQLGGPGLDQWNVDELSVLTNMTVEGGLMTGVVEPCRRCATS
jgi:3-isopropylmalate/(R)-2-methylmalate dehydratase large subunit